MANRVTELLDSRYKTKILTATVTSVPLTNDGRSVGYVLANVGDVSGVQVLVDPDQTPYATYDTLEIQGYGTPANTTYYAVRRTNGARPTSLMTQFYGDVEIQGGSYYAGEILLGDLLTGPNTLIGSGSMRLRLGQTDSITLNVSTSSIRVGQSGEYPNTYITPTAVDLRTGSTIRIHLASSGSGYIGNGGTYWDTAGNLNVQGSASLGGWVIGASELTSDGGNIALNSGIPALLMGSATGYKSGTGIFIGKDGSTYKAHFGNPGGQYMAWNGNALEISGRVPMAVWGALMACHYDGPEPYASNFTGDANGHMGQVATTAGGVIYRPAKFGKGIQIAEATTNLIANPSLEVDTTGWGSFHATIARSTDRSYYGGASLGFWGDTDGNASAWIAFSGTAGRTYTATAWVYNTRANAIKIGIYNTADGHTRSAYHGGTGWERLSVTKTIAGTGELAFFIYDLSGSGWVGIRIDGVQVEEKAYSTPYCDGSLGAGHSWTGTAHASTSSRGVASLRYATGMNPTAGTVAFWVSHENYTGTWQVYFDSYGSAEGITFYKSAADGGVPAIRHYGAGSVESSVQGSALSAGAHHLAFTWDDNGSGDKLRLYVDGAVVGSMAGTYTPMTNAAAFGNLFVGVDRASARFECNDVIDDLIILDRAMTAAEIQALYNSNAPALPATSNWAWKSPTGLAWSDEMGLWCVDGDGNPVLGVSGSDSKAWGGFTISKGDIVFGYNAASSAAILWDKSSGSFGFYGDGESTPQVTISASGRIMAGGGRITLDASSLSLTPTDDIGKLATDTGTAIRWYTSGCTSGRISAVNDGSNDEWLDLVGGDVDGEKSAQLRLRYVGVGAPRAEISFNGTGASTGYLDVYGNINVESNLYTTSSGAGVTGLYVIPKVTPGGMDGALGFDGGIIIAYIAPT